MSEARDKEADVLFLGDDQIAFLEQSMVFLYSCNLFKFLF